MFKSAAIIFSGALMLLAGCATTPRDNSSSPSGSGGTYVEIPSPLSHPVPPVPPVAKTNPPPAVVAPAPPLLVWTSLNRWAAEQKLAPPRKISSSPVTAYSVASKNGVLVLDIGSLDATWNGVGLHLGFAPEIVDDQVYVYGVDLQKNLEPLLLGAPPASSRERVIVLDPGHGGVNVGTHSVVDGRFEKEFTLDWARRLQALLAANGCQVFLTRTNDADISLSNRVAFAEARHADLFISLHFNSAALNQRQAGIETYCLTPTGLPSTLTRGYSDLLTDHYANNTFDGANLQLAVRLQTALLRAAGEEDRGVRRARFMGVLQGQRRPAVLVEGGFLSNPQEAAKIESAAFRQKLAEGVAAALDQTGNEMTQAKTGN